VLLFLILFGLPLAMASSGRTLSDGDVSWHVAAGRWILAHGAVPSVDPFSFTAAGRPWTAMEWLADIIFASAFRIAGYAGLVTVVAAALMALNTIVFSYLRPRTSPIALVIVILAMDVVLTPFTLARPHVLVWPLLAGWTVTLLRASEAERPPPLWAALLLVLWTNMHASFPIAVPVGAAIAFDALQKTRWRNWRGWALFALVSLVAVSLNANGLRGLLYPFKVASLAMLPLIQEWQPSTLTGTPQFYVAVAAGLGALLWTGVRVPLGRLALLLAMLGLALSQMRHQSWFVIVAACAVPPLFGPAKTAMRDFGRLGLAAIPLLLVRAAVPFTPPAGSANPTQLIAAVPPSLRNQPVLNGYTFGGPLILAGIRPYIDGRSDMYGDAFVLDYSRILDGDEARFDQAVRKYGIRWTMLPAGNHVLIAKLDSSKDWRRLYADKVGVIHVRRN
jgi:hypothetical protein